MKVHSIARAVNGTMGDIANGGMTPVTKDSGHPDAKRVATFDDRAAASMLAAEVMAQVIANDNVWRGYANRIIQMTIEGRAAFLETIGASLKEMKKRNTLDGAVEAKMAAKRVNSATVEVSKLRAVAHAFNSGAHIEGLQHYAQQVTKCASVPAFDQIGYALLVEYARTFSEAKAGRKADTWTQKFAKFLERNVPAEDDKVGRAQYDAAVKLSNSFAG